MKLTDAINTVERKYVTGAIAHYGKFKVDPWQTACDELDTLLRVDSENINPIAVEKWCNTILKLIERFKNDGISSSELSNADAFMLGNVNRVKAFQSLEHRECVHCESRKDLELRPFDGANNEMQMICKKCLDYRENRGTKKEAY